MKSQSNTSTPTVALAMCTGYILGAMIDVSLIRQRLCVRTERNSSPLVFSYRKAGFDHKTLFVIHDDWPVKDLGQSGHPLLIGVHLETITP